MSGANPRCYRHGVQGHWPWPPEAEKNRPPQEAMTGKKLEGHDTGVGEMPTRTTNVEMDEAETNQTSTLSVRERPLKLLETDRSDDETGTRR